MKRLPDGAAAAIDRYVAACDDAVPGLLVGLHVCGSLALDDYDPERSDIDVVAVVAAETTAEQRSHLAEIHRVVATRVDGPYLTAAQLAGAPADVGPVPHHVAGRFDTGTAYEVSPITWMLLADHAITVRGPVPRDLGVVADPDAVRAFSAANLGDYWKGWARTVGGLIADTDDDDEVDAHSLEWCVLGVARVAIGARCGRVVSKRAAGERARSAVGDEWAPVVQLALDARAGERRAVAVRDLRRACEFVQAVVQAG